MAQGVGAEFKLQYHKKKKKRWLLVEKRTRDWEEQAVIIKD
jgi:hypothetical protein